MKDSIEITFEVAAFSILAIQKACYRFSDIASFEVQPKNDSITVKATPLSQRSEEGLEFLVQRLRNEAIDQQLREKIREQTEGVRNLILAHAFSKTGLIELDGKPPEA